MPCTGCFMGLRPARCAPGMVQVIDTVKHAVLGKFNDVRPGIYREFHQVSPFS